MRRTYATRNQMGKGIGMKVKKVIDAGEFPNTPTGRKQALGMAYGMQKAGRLTDTGEYLRVKKKKM
jgi:hypothetical protein